MYVTKRSSRVVKQGDDGDNDVWESRKRKNGSRRQPRMYRDGIRQSVKGAIHFLSHTQERVTRTKHTIVLTRGAFYEFRTLHRLALSKQAAVSRERWVSGTIAILFAVAHTRPARWILPKNKQKKKRARGYWCVGLPTGRHFFTHNL